MIYKLIPVLIPAVLFLHCASYTINVATIPARRVEIFVNQEYKATTDENGTASVKIERVSFENSQLIEAKAENYYGCVTVSYRKNVLPEMQNVCSVVNRDPKAGQKTAKIQYDIVFVVPKKTEVTPVPIIAETEPPLVETQFWDEKTLNARFEQSGYLSTRKEKADFKKLSFAEKQIFWDNFWQQRDTDPATELNEFRIHYFERVEIANRRFSLQQKEGWKTDQGRVWILYGQPDEVESYPQQLETPAYEIWHYYHFQGGVEFVFVGLSGGRELRLVHSTARNELFDDDWERWLKPKTP